MTLKYTREREAAPISGDVYEAKIDGRRCTVVRVWRHGKGEEPRALMMAEDGSFEVIDASLLGRRGMRGWRLAQASARDAP